MVKFNRSVRVVLSHKKFIHAMQKTTLMYLVSVLLLSGAALGVLYETGTLENRAPAVHRFLKTHLPPKISYVKWRNRTGTGHAPLDSHLHKFKADLMKFMPDESALLDLLTPKRYRDKEGADVEFNFRPGPEKPPDRIYTWIDGQGVRHYSNVRPRRDQFDTRADIREIPWDE